MTDTTTRRGTSNTNERGSTLNRRRRRAWIMTTYASDVVGFYRCYRCGCLLYNPDATPDDTTGLRLLTIDRIVAGCHGGTYRRNNIRPCCSLCNIKTGGYVHRKNYDDQEETWKS